MTFDPLVLAVRLAAIAWTGWTVSLTLTSLTGPRLTWEERLARARVASAAALSLGGTLLILMTVRP